MKHLLNGVAIAAVFAIAAPALAQTNAPMTPAPPSAKSAPAMAPAKTTSAMPKKPMRMRHMASHRMMYKGDSMTEDLNRQELARITGGGAPAPMGGQPQYGGNAPTSGAAGPFAPGAGAAPPPPPGR